MEEVKYKRVQCVDRTLDILNAIANGGCHTVAEIAAEANLLSATAYNIVKTLMSRQAVVRRTGTYAIGPSIGMLGNKWDSAADLPGLYRPAMERYHALSGNPYVSLSILNHGILEVYVLMADTMRSEYLKRIFEDPMETASGRVILANMDKSEWMNFIEKHISSENVDVHEKNYNHYDYYKQLEKIAVEKSITLSLRGKNGELAAISVPVFSISGTVLGALGCSLKDDLSEENLHNHLGYLKEVLRLGK